MTAAICPAPQCPASRVQSWNRPEESLSSTQDQAPLVGTSIPPRLKGNGRGGAHPTAPAGPAPGATAQLPASNWSLLLWEQVFLRDFSFHPQQHRKPESLAERTGSRDNAGARAERGRGAPGSPRARATSPLTPAFQLFPKWQRGGHLTSTPLTSSPPPHFPNSPGLLRTGAPPTQPIPLRGGGLESSAAPPLPLFLASS